MRKKLVIVPLLITVCMFVFLTGCFVIKREHKTLINFKSYNQLEMQPGQEFSEDFLCEIDGKRYEVMDGYAAKHFQIIEDSEDNQYKLLLVDSDRKELFTIMTERNYEIEAVRECTDTDGEVYLFYSKWNTEIGNLFLDELQSSHILQMNMENYTLQQEYVFPEEVIVLTIHDGYVYTVEDGRIYRSLLQDGTDKECMADLGYRGIPKEKDIGTISFCTEKDGIVVEIWIPDENNEYVKKKVIAADFKYTDPPMEPNVLRRIHRAGVNIL